MRSLRRSGVVLHSLSNPRTFGRARPAKSHLLHTSARANWEAAAPVASTFILVVVVLTAVAFDFTNGFHDTANAVATSIATGALKPIVAVIMSGCLNFVGAFISISVAATIAKGIVDPAVTSSAGGSHSASSNSPPSVALNVRVSRFQRRRSPLGTRTVATTL